MNLIMNYARRNSITLNINQKEKHGHYPLLWATKFMDESMVKALIEYAEETNTILTVNDKDEDEKMYPLMYAVVKNNNRIVKMITEYADRHNIKLELEEKNNDDEYPLLKMIKLKNIEMLKTVLEYAKKNKISVHLKEDHIKNIILKDNNKKKNSNVNSEIVKLLQKYHNENVVDISFSNNSELLKRFNEIKDSSPSTDSTSNTQDNINLPPPTDGDLAIVLYDFNGTLLNELSIHKDEYLVVQNWNIKDGWAFGYKRDDPTQKGDFPSPLVRKCDVKENENKLDSKINDIGNTSKPEENLPSYEDINKPNSSSVPTYQYPYQSPYLYYPYGVPPQNQLYGMPQNQRPPAPNQPPMPMYQMPPKPQYVYVPGQQPPSNQQYGMPSAQRPPLSPGQSSYVPNQQPFAPGQPPFTPGQSYQVPPNQQYPYAQPYYMGPNYRKA